MDNYAESGLVRFEYNHFPFLGEESFRTAIASQCADNQGMFWQYHDTIFLNWQGENVGTYSWSNLNAMAGGLGLDEDEFADCLNDNSIRDEIENQVLTARQRGVGSTPTIFINGQIFLDTLTFESYQNQINSLLGILPPE
ncbi:MAG: thioredoxin domain-containing protein [Chloroflexi bacterium]|nr:thioredoxin domain-containing protein [Chloroflexota bacterium]